MNTLNCKIPFNLPYLSGKETEYVTQALSSLQHCGNRTFGEKCIALLKGLYGFPNVFLTPSCTAAMEMGALLCDLQPGDEVILPSYTFSSTANAIVLRGAKPVFCEIDPDTMNIDVNKIERLITQKTKMILPIDYAGIPCDIDAIMEMANEHNLCVMQDAAQSLHSFHSKNRPCGTVPHLAAFSFHETKNVSCGEGGALVVNDASLVERANFLQEKGTNRSLVLRGIKSKYSWVDIGSSFLLADLLAAILLAQLETVDSIVKKRRNVIQAYQATFSTYENMGNVRLANPSPEVKINNHAYFVIFDTEEHRSTFLSTITKRNVFPYIGYIPLHSSPYGQKLGYHTYDLPITEDFAKRIVRMPLYTTLQEKDLGFCINQLEHTMQQIYRSGQS